MDKLDTRPKPFVFVLMPLAEDFNDVYKLGIKAACDNAGAYAERVDEQLFQGSILQRIYNQIAKADVIVSDMTGRNANVFYETGYAHALGKHVVLLTQRVEDIPFDLMHHTHIVYEGKIAELIPQLEKRIKWAVEHSIDERPRSARPVDLYVQGSSLSSSLTIRDEARSEKGTPIIYLKIDAHNPDDRRIEIARFKVAFLTSNRLERSRCKFGPRDPNNRTVRPPEGGWIHLVPEEYVLLPGEWQAISIEFRPSTIVPVGDIENITLRVLSEYGRHDCTFTVEISPQNKK